MGCGFYSNKLVSVEFPSHPSHIKPSILHVTELQLQACGSERCHFLLGNFSWYLVPLEVTVTKTKIQILEIVLRFLFGCLLSKFFSVLQYMHERNLVSSCRSFN